MEVTTENLSMLSNLLTQSLSPSHDIRHPAEATLKSSETQAGFLLLVLGLVRTAEVPMHVRQAGGVYFKNVIKKRWSEVSRWAGSRHAPMISENAPCTLALQLTSSRFPRQDSDISEFDRTAIKSQLVPIMVSLSTSESSRLQAQLGEAVSEVASYDFPEKWPTLVTVSLLPV